MAWGQQTLLTSPPSIWSTNFHQTPHLQICYNLFFPSPEKSLLAWKHSEDHFLLHHESVIFWTVLQAVIPLLTKWRHTSNVSSSDVFFTFTLSFCLCHPLDGNGNCWLMVNRESAGAMQLHDKQQWIGRTWLHLFVQLQLNKVELVC